MQSCCETAEPALNCRTLECKWDICWLDVIGQNCIIFLASLRYHLKSVLLQIYLWLDCCLTFPVNLYLKTAEVVTKGKKKKKGGISGKLQTYLKHFVLSSEQKTKLQHLSRPLSLLNIFWLSQLPIHLSKNSRVTGEIPLWEEYQENPFQWLFCKE